MDSISRNVSWHSAKDLQCSPPLTLEIVSVSSVPSLSRVQLSATPWTAAHQASLSITNSWSLLRLMSIEWVLPNNPEIVQDRPFLISLRIIYLFLAVLALHCREGFSLVAASGGYCLAVCAGFSSQRLL